MQNDVEDYVMHDAKGSSLSLNKWR